MNNLNEISYLIMSKNNSDDHDIQLQKQPSRGVKSKRYSENIQQIYRRTPWRSVFDVMRAIRSLFNDNNKYYSQLI